LTISIARAGTAQQIPVAGWQVVGRSIDTTHDAASRKAVRRDDPKKKSSGFSPVVGLMIAAGPVFTLVAVLGRLA
jgi:hypothetical protein